MEQNSFNLVADKVGAALEEQGYKTAKAQKPEEDGLSALYTGEEIAYSILYRESKKRFELRTCDMSDGAPGEKWKSVSMWLFDPETDSADQAQSIVDDFIETIQGPKQMAVVRNKKKRRKDDDNNVDAIFFFNRFVGIFPELKDEIAEEKAAYGDVRGVTFTREKLLPKIDMLCSQNTDKDAVNRCGGLLNDMYVSGDMDVRSIITIVILNGISDRAAEALQPQFSEELAKGYKSGLKMKGKKVKPEKKKKRKSFMARTLNEMDH
ncbi:MAG TPA: hypothetical protein VHP31_07420 [Caproicibacter sp.]|nr:hypothetical protein [Caproicibacter sp.]